MDHPLSVLLAEVAIGKHPPTDGRVTVMPPPDDRLCGVLAFTAHHVVLADVSPEWVRARLRPGDLAAPLNPRFLAALAERTGRLVSSIDAVMVAPAADGEPDVELHPSRPAPHEYRTDLHQWECDGGLVTLGRGLADRWEVAVEVERSVRGHGLGRTLFAAARRLTAGLAGPGEPVWAQVAPGNVASVRALLEAGYRPGGAEALLFQPA
jgi:GNAT superfamily N-acetyltransferase